MMRILRFMIVVILETITIPLKLLIVLWTIGYAIYGRIEFGLTFKEAWNAVKEGFMETIYVTKHFINTGIIN